MTENLLTVDETATLLHLKYTQVIRRIKSGTLAAEKYGWQWMIKQEDAEALKEVMTHEGH